MSGTVASSRASRALALLALVVLLVVVTGGAALAVEAGSEDPAAAEEDHEPKTINDIGTQNEVSQAHLPEESELPAFQRWLYVPLLVVGIVVIAGLLFRHLQWQPRFAEERRSKRRR